VADLDVARPRLLDQLRPRLEGRTVERRRESKRNFLDRPADLARLALEVADIEPKLDHRSGQFAHSVGKVFDGIRTGTDSGLTRIKVPQAGLRRIQLTTCDRRCGRVP